MCECANENYFFLKQKKQLKKYIFLIVILISCLHSEGQDADSIVWNQKTFTQKLTSIPPYPIKGRIIGISAAYAAGWTGTLIALNEIWYKNYPKSGFHTFNDSKEWLQVDKIGHLYSAYRLGLGYSSVLQWSGLDKDKSVYIGALSGVVSQSVIEILDGYSDEWGFSWSDMGANILGSGMYAGQHALWGEQRVWFKFSTHKYKHPQGMLSDRADNLYGTTPFELIFKDYNAQTYWLSANLNAFFPQSRLPKWLNLAVGYGGDGMYGGFENKWIDNNIAYDRTDVPRLRQYYLSPDIDLSRIDFRSKFLNSFFETFNIKTPLPTLEINSAGKLKFHAIYF